MQYTTREKHVLNRTKAIFEYSFHIHIYIYYIVRLASLTTLSRSIPVSFDRRTRVHVRYFALNSPLSRLHLTDSAALKLIRTHT